jgi:ABC-type proline/glycine betaine transport system substrate-binding protein
MFNKRLKERQGNLESWLYTLEFELDRLNQVLDLMESQNNKLHNRVAFLDVTAEAHEMDLEFLKANIKTKKKGNK